MKLEYWFPTPIWSCKLDYDWNKLVDYAYDLRSKDQGREISNVNGWQSNDLYRDDDSPIVDLINIFNIKSDECLYDFQLQTNGIQVGNYWININPPGALNKSHIHTGSFLSGVYYAKTDYKTGQIEFQNDSLKSYIYGEYKNIGDSPITHTECRYIPEPGTLIIFPSWLPHSVEINNSTEDRISLSFNTRIIP